MIYRNDGLDSYRVSAAMRYASGVTPFRLGQAIGTEAPNHSTYAIPYKVGTRGYKQFIKGVRWGHALRSEPPKGIRLFAYRVEAA